jgi:diguanylate cyclase (GGDEF)-like protein/PAS domain S-box-containing protein
MFIYSLSHAVLPWIGIITLLSLLGGAMMAVIVRRPLLYRNQATEDRLYRLIENVPGVIYRYVMHSDGRDAFTYISAYCRELYEVEPEAVIANSSVLWALINPEDAIKMQISAQAAIRNLTPWHAEYRIRTASGQVKWLQAFASPVQIKQEVFWDGVVMDISDRKQTEALRANYQLILENQVQARTIELCIANKELERLARLDGLTQLANRRAFDLCLEEEWLRHAREQKRMSVIIGDVDCFKSYNDHYGHIQGDVCLQRVARAIAGVIKRPSDLVARYGGEEFVILLPNTDEKGAAEVAEQVHGAIMLLGLAHDASIVHPYVTMSFGVATGIPNPHSLRSSPKSLLELADQALYQSKTLGRDRITQVVDQGSPVAFRI